MSGVKHHHGFAIVVFAELSTASAISSHAVVGHEDEDGIFFKIPLGKLGHEAAHVLVDVFNHAVKAGSLFGEAEIGEALGVGRRRDEGAVWRIGGDVGEEGFVGFLGLFHPTHGGGEEEVGAVALGFYEGAIVTNGGVEVFVAGDVRTRTFVALADASGSVDKDFIESALVGLIGFFVAEVPFTEDTGSVAGGF